MTDIYDVQQTRIRQAALSTTTKVLAAGQRAFIIDANGTIVGEVVGDGSTAAGSLPRYAPNKADMGLEKVDNTSDADKPISTATQTALDGKVDKSGAVKSVSGRKGDVVLAKADVGLGNVDNTADADKPISTAQQAALQNIKAAISKSVTNASSTFFCGCDDSGAEQVRVKDGLQADIAFTAGADVSGLTVTAKNAQAIPNGNMETDSNSDSIPDGFTLNNASAVSLSGNVFTFKATTPGTTGYVSSPTISPDKYFGTIQVQTQSSNAHFLLNNGTDVIYKAITASDDYQTIYDICNTTAGSGRNYVQAADYDMSSNWTQIDSSGFSSITYSNYVSTVNLHGTPGWEHLYRQFNVISGQTYTFSFDYTLSATNGSGHFYVLASNSAPRDSGDNVSGNLGNIQINVTTSTVSKTRKYFTFTATGSTVYLDFSFGHLPDGFAFTILFGNFKLELGNKATDWSPAPQVGGRNLALNTATSKTVSGDGSFPVTIDPFYRLSKALNGETVTLSFDITVSSGATGYIFIATSGHWVNLWGSSCASIAGKTTHFTQTNTLSSSNTDTSMYLQSPSGDDSLNGSVTISNFKLEQGTVATGWSPAPEDYPAGISVFDDSGDYVSIKTCMAIDMGADASNPLYNLTADQMAALFPAYTAPATTTLTIPGSFAAGDTFTRKNGVSYKNGVAIATTGDYVQYLGGTVALTATSGAIPWTTSTYLADVLGQQAELKAAIIALGGTIV